MTELENATSATMLGLQSSQVEPNLAWPGNRRALNVEQMPARIGTGTPDASAGPHVFTLPWHTWSPTTHTPTHTHKHTDTRMQG